MLVIIVRTLDDVPGTRRKKFFADAISNSDPNKLPILPIDTPRLRPLSSQPLIFRQLESTPGDVPPAVEIQGRLS
jgi:hypothetical protein